MRARSTQWKKWPGARLGLGLVVGGALLFWAAWMAPVVAADGAASGAVDQSSPELYMVPIAVGGQGVMLDTRGTVRAAVVATRDAQGKVTIECRDEVVAAEEVSR